MFTKHVLKVITQLMEIFINCMKVQSSSQQNKIGKILSDKMQYKTFIFFHCINQLIHMLIEVLNLLYICGTELVFFSLTHGPCIYLTQYASYLWTTKFPSIFINYENEIYRGKSESDCYVHRVFTKSIQYIFSDIFLISTFILCTISCLHP